jgi:hypothetical protein
MLTPLLGDRFATGLIRRKRCWASDRGRALPGCGGVAAGSGESRDAGGLTAQALAVAVPWALGDALAIMSFHVQQWRSLGYGGLLAGWSLTAGRW